MKFVLFLSLLVLTAVHGQEPNVRTVFSENGFKEVISIAVEIINQKFGHLTFPDETLRTKIPVLGDVNVFLTDINMNGFQITNAAFVLGSSDDVTLSLTANFAISMHVKWKRVHWPHISNSADLDIVPKTGASLTVSMTLGVTSDGHIIVKETAAGCNLGDLDIKFHHSWIAWLYNIIVDLLHNALEKDIQNAVDTELQRVVDQDINAALAKLTTTIEIGGGRARVTIDVGMDAVYSEPSLLSLGVKFSEKDNMTGQACPFAPPQLPTSAPVPKMLEVLIADTVFNCAVWVSFTNGAIHTFVDQNTSSKLPLNTDDWADFIPQLAKMYPNTSMAMNISALQQPAIATDPSAGVSASLNFSLNTSVQLPAMTKHVFTLWGGIEMSLDITAAQVGPNATIFANISSLEFSLGLIDTAIGPIDLSLLQALAKVAGPLIQALIDEAIHAGFVLPGFDNIYMINPSIVYNKSYFTISTDFKFQ